VTHYFIERRSLYQQVVISRLSWDLNVEKHYGEIRKSKTEKKRIYGKSKKINIEQ
jgi:hypothetical protein